MKFCSRDCYRKSVGRRPAIIEVTCAQCGTTFRRTQAAVNRHDHSFCSTRCQHEFNTGENNASWRGGNRAYRGAGWRRLAEEIRQRDGYRCRRCGKHQDDEGSRLSVDHILPFRSFDDIVRANDPSNLVSLCRSCHAKKARAESGWLRGDVLDMWRYQTAVSQPWGEAGPRKEAQISLTPPDSPKTLPRMRPLAWCREAIRSRPAPGSSAQGHPPPCVLRGVWGRAQRPNPSTRFCGRLGNLMTRGSWSRSAARPAARGARPAGSWAASLARARAAWDELAGAPVRGAEARVAVGRGPLGSSRGVPVHVAGCGAVLSSGRYSDVAAAAILSTALGLWADTAAALDGDGLDGTADMGTD